MNIPNRVSEISRLLTERITKTRTYAILAWSDGCMPPPNKWKIRAVRYRSACHRRGMNVAFKYTVLTLSFSFLTHYTVATYIRPTLYIWIDAQLHWFSWNTVQLRSSVEKNFVREVEEYASRTKFSSTEDRSSWSWASSQCIFFGKRNRKSQRVPNKK